MKDKEKDKKNKQRYLSPSFRKGAVKEKKEEEDDGDFKINLISENQMKMIKNQKVQVHQNIKKVQNVKMIKRMIKKMIKKSIIIEALPM